MSLVGNTNQKILPTDASELNGFNLASDCDAALGKVEISLRGGKKYLQVSLGIWY